MATGGRRIESYYAQGMLEIRSTLHLAVKLTMRTVMVVDQAGAASEGAGLWRVALPAFMVLDVIVWLILRRSDRFGLSWRLPLDATDAAFWTLSPLPPSGTSDVALFLVIPLAVEAGVRMGIRGMVVPAAVMVSTTVSVIAVDKPVQVMGIIWLAVAVLVGMAFFRYCAHLHRQAESMRQRALGAGRRRAFLAGQNHVAMGASSAVDVIEGLVPVLGRPEPGSALWQLAEGWKGQLSASTTQEAKYLQVALLEWARLHNSHPDLSGLVELRVDEGHGTTLLSAGQVAWLSRTLESMGLHGRVTVRVQTAAERLPGEELRLDVDGTTVVIPADGRPPPPPLDLAAVPYFYVASLVASWAPRPGGSVPFPLVLAGLAACGLGGVLAHRQTGDLNAKARAGLYLAVAVGTILTLAHSTARSPINPDGNPNLAGFANGVMLTAFIAGFYWDSLRAWRWLMPAAILANTAIAVALYPVPGAVDARDVMGAVVGALFPFFACRHLTSALGRVTAQHVASTRAADEEAVRTAFVDGRESVVGLVRQAGQDALAQLDRLGPQLEARLSELAALRLEEVDRRLSRLDP
jgi:hypothetical protein